MVSEWDWCECLVDPKVGEIQLYAHSVHVYKAREQYTIHTYVYMYMYARTVFKVVPWPQGWLGDEGGWLLTSEGNLVQ